MLWHPECVNSVTYRSKCDAALPVIVSPSSNGLRSVILILQAVEVVGLRQDILRIFVVSDEMLLVVDYEVFDTRGNRMIVVLDINLERTQRGMTHVSSAHDLPIIFR